MFKTIDVSERKGNNFKDLTGNKYGRLTVVGLSDKKSGRKSFWVCKCDCGNEKLVRSDSLKSGDVKSCGCLKKEQDDINLDRTAHNHSKTNLHSKWLGIKARCYNPKEKAYKYYGARGITMCDEWKNDFVTFENWALNNGYTPDLTIERINVNDIYKPENCKWIPFKEQANNRRTTIWIEWQGQKKSLTQWADELGINRGTLNSRYSRDGLRPPELFKPVARKYRGN